MEENKKVDLEIVAAVVSNPPISLIQFHSITFEASRCHGETPTTKNTDCSRYNPRRKSSSIREQLHERLVEKTLVLVSNSGRNSFCFLDLAHVNYIMP